MALYWAEVSFLLPSYCSSCERIEYRFHNGFETAIKSRWIVFLSHLVAPRRVSFQYVYIFTQMLGRKLKKKKEIKAKCINECVCVSVLCAIERHKWKQNKITKMRRRRKKSSNARPVDKNDRYTRWLDDAACRRNFIRYILTPPINPLRDAAFLLFFFSIRQISFSSVRSDCFLLLL